MSFTINLKRNSVQHAVVSLSKNYPDKNSQERNCHCIRMVRFAVTAVAEILIREYKKDNE